MSVSNDDPVWKKKIYGGEKQEHDSTIQDWQVAGLQGGPVALRFKEFATKHLLKPSTTKDPLEKAAIIQSKRARKHPLSQDPTSGHWQVKYGGTVTQKNTMIDLSRINLKDVLCKFAQAILNSESQSRWKKDESRKIAADLGTAAFIVATESEIMRVTEKQLTFSAKKLGNRSYEIFHLDPLRSHRRGQ
jgi:hypothetical protein